MTLPHHFLYTIHANPQFPVPFEKLFLRGREVLIFGYSNAGPAKIRVVFGSSGTERSTNAEISITKEIQYI